jgi:hypothetical protein
LGSTQSKGGIAWATLHRSGDFAGKIKLRAPVLFGDGRNPPGDHDNIRPQSQVGAIVERGRGGITIYAILVKISIVLDMLSLLTDMSNLRIYVLGFYRSVRRLRPNPLGRPGALATARN